jgi:hypothetical protein
MRWEVWFVRCKGLIIDSKEKFFEDQFAPQLTAFGLWLLASGTEDVVCKVRSLGRILKKGGFLIEEGHIIRPDPGLAP